MGNKDKEPYKTWKKQDKDIDKRKICPKCEGLGDVKDSDGVFTRCPECKGEGTVPR